jgi:hypothetical protein
MGAHSLGKAKFANSGYDGVWIPLRETTFDNEMFITLKEHSGLFTLTVLPSSYFILIFGF